MRPAAVSSSPPWKHLTWPACRFLIYKRGKERFGLHGDPAPAKPLRGEHGPASAHFPRLLHMRPRPGDSLAKRPRVSRWHQEAADPFDDLVRDPPNRAGHYGKPVGHRL